ncbi:thioester domain-containing protein [Streptomyces sp. DT171]|uniref:thioester domain-containing protein n=1 Tax=Streptomyces sp. DT171 TaxID=3416524 RepID=UPI003CF6A159
MAASSVRGRSRRRGEGGRSGGDGDARTAGRGGAARIAASVLLAGLVAAGTFAGAGTAAAEDAPQHQGGATAVLDGLKTFDRAVLVVNGGKRELPAGLFEMTVDGGGRLKTYSVDIHNPTQDQAGYLETSWDQTSLGANRNAGRIRWILQHSYPRIDDLSALARQAGTGPLTEGTAAAGTQVAIWRFSDKATVNAADKQAEKLADWLQKHARDTAEPGASLALDMTTVSGRSGQRLGPVTVRTAAAQVSVTPPADSSSGVRVTDRNGRPVVAAANGSQLYFDVPADAADGSASLAVQATTSVPVGRVFAASSKSQAQILAGSSDSTVSAGTTATWAATGAVPAFSARKNCALGSVDVTATNKGDQPFTYELVGIEHTVVAGGSGTVTVPVAEDQPYALTVIGPGGLQKTFKGVLDCRTTASAVTDAADLSRVGTQSGNQPVPASAGGGSGGPAGDLAATGGSSGTALTAGIALVLVVVGGGAVFALRRN